VILYAATASRGAPSYTIQRVGDLDFLPFGINISSEIAGSVSPTPQAAIWEPGVTTQLSPPGLQLGAATALNNLGQVVGWGFNGGVEQGFYWNPSSGFIDLNIPAGQTTLFHAINNRGQIGGLLRPTNSLGPDIACIWTAESPTPLPSLSDGDSAVLSLNDSGAAVGTSATKYDPNDPNMPFAPTHAVIWEGGHVIDLTPYTPWSEAESINNHGQVVGWRNQPNTSTTYLPFIWDATNGLVDLPYLRRGARPSAINNEAQIVGSIDGNVAALWQDGSIYDLNDLLFANTGWSLEYATGINDLGQIVGYGTYNGQQEGFLLTPLSDSSNVPEPSTLLLFLPALLLRRRRSRI